MLAGERRSATPTNDMKQRKSNKPEVRAGQVASPKYDSIKLGIDWHVAQYRVVRLIDGAGPEPAQRFTPQAFLGWVEKHGPWRRRSTVVTRPGWAVLSFIGN